ncbi:hypothetical protein FALB51S_02694 [Frigidibacter albus]
MLTNSQSTPSADDMTQPHWPIRIITLESDAARRAPLMQRLDELGLTYELSFGIDGRAGLSPELEARIDRVAAGCGR